MLRALQRAAGTHCIWSALNTAAITSVTARTLALRRTPSLRVRCANAGQAAADAFCKR